MRLTEDAERERSQREIKIRLALSKFAKRSILEIILNLYNKICLLAPSAKLIRSNDSFLQGNFYLPKFLFMTKILNNKRRSAEFISDIKIGDISIECRLFESPNNNLHPILPEFEEQFGILEKGIFIDLGWDVVIGARIYILQDRQIIRGSSLWYADLSSEGSYRWYEVGYRHRRWFSDDLIVARSPGSAKYRLSKISEGPLAIDDEAESDFQRRWIDFLHKSSH